jgi:hypothetical protein
MRCGKGEKPVARAKLVSAAERSARALHRLYALVSLASYHLEEMARVDRSGGV